MSIFNENGNYINLKDPLERMPYMLQEVNMICNNYDYITEGININDIKNAIKKAWLKFKTFIVDALRSIKIKINDNTNKLLRYIEKNKTKVDDLLKDNTITTTELSSLDTLINKYNNHNIDNIIKQNADANNTELLSIIRGELTSIGSPVSADKFKNELSRGGSFKGIITDSNQLIKTIKEYQNMIKSIDTVIKKTEQSKIVETLNKDPNLDFTNGLISIYNTLLSYVIKTVNTGIKEIINVFKGKSVYGIRDKVKFGIYDIPNSTDNKKYMREDEVEAYFEKFNNQSDDEQIATILKVKDGAMMLSVIENPSEKVQLAAVNHNPSYINAIAEPTEKVKQLYKEKTGKDYVEYD